MVLKFYQQKPITSSPVRYWERTLRLVCSERKYTQKEKAVLIGIGTAFNILEITYFLFKKSFTSSGAMIASTKV